MTWACMVARGFSRSPSGTLPVSRGGILVARFHTDKPRISGVAGTRRSWDAVSGGACRPGSWCPKSVVQAPVRGACRYGDECCCCAKAVHRTHSGCGQRRCWDLWLCALRPCRCRRGVQWLGAAACRVAACWVTAGCRGWPRCGVAPMLGCARLRRCAVLALRPAGGCVAALNAVVCRSFPSLGFVGAPKPFRGVHFLALLRTQAVAGFQARRRLWADLSDVGGSIDPR